MPFGRLAASARHGNGLAAGGTAREPPGRAGGTAREWTRVTSAPSAPDRMVWMPLSCR